MVDTFSERIDADLKNAMRERDTVTRDTLRMVMAALKNRRIELQRDLEPPDEIGVLQKAHKSRLDSAQQYSDAGREELAEKERTEASLISNYLPKQLGEEETRTIVQAIVDELGLTEKKEMGQVMKAVMARHKGEVDGKLVQKAAGELLS